jgi:cellulose synthase/poly-beta-1,6-N-acetylglucosamine synthase-like glycosyltransferase
MVRGLLLACMLIGSLYVAIVAVLTLLSMLHTWRTPELANSIGFGDAPPSARHFFSVIVPARHEERVLKTTLLRLLATEHPHFEILVVVGHDDHATRAVGESVSQLAPGRVRVVVDYNDPKSKPKALNTALPYCRGDIVGIFDAEDEVHPELLTRVDGCFQHGTTDVVQAGVQLMNYRSHWFSLRNVLEYFFWFRSRLHLQARRRFIPLGGNTVFVWTTLLRAVGGWDPECLAEDCELGVRLSVLGARVRVAYDAELVTREETPEDLGAFLRQRTRWNQGFLQVLHKGDWRRLPSARERLFAIWTLSSPFLQALIGLTIVPFIAGMLLVKAPILLALATFVPAILLFTTLAVEAAGLREFCRSYDRGPRLNDYLRLLWTTPFYQAALAAAAVRAVLRETSGVRNWEKTRHAGAHRETSIFVPHRPVQHPRPIHVAMQPGEEKGHDVVTGLRGPGGSGSAAAANPDLTRHVIELARAAPFKEFGMRVSIRPDLIRRVCERNLPQSEPYERQVLDGSHRLGVRRTAVPGSLPNELLEKVDVVRQA